MVEHRLAKARVAGSNPVSRSNIQSPLKISSSLMPHDGAHDTAFAGPSAFFLIDRADRTYD